MKKLLAIIILFTLSFSANAQMDGIYVFNAVGASFAEHGKSYSKVEPVDLFIYWDTDKGLIEINSKELQKYTYSKFTKTETNEYARLRAIARDKYGKIVVLYFYEFNNGNLLFIVEFSDASIRYVLNQND